MCYLTPPRSPRQLGRLVRLVELHAAVRPRAAAEAEDLRQPQAGQRGPGLRRPRHPEEVSTEMMMIRILLLTWCCVLQVLHPGVSPHARPVDGLGGLERLHHGLSPVQAAQLQPAHTS